jgi:glycolate oxidase iron-sulfur subunit
MPMRVAYDAACHLLHGQGIDAAPQTLLRSIPQLELVPLANADRCCGSAGVYNLLHPQMASTLGQWKAQSILDAQVDAVVTGNSGCILQIGSTLQSLLARESPGTAIEVLHPMELLQRAYSQDGAWR